MAKKGNNLKKLVKSAKTPKGFAVIATVALAVAVGAYAISAFAWSGTCTEISKTSSGGKYSCKAGQKYSATFTKKYCIAAKFDKKPARYALTTSATNGSGAVTSTVNDANLNICTDGKGKATFKAAQANWTMTWKYP